MSGRGKILRGWKVRLRELVAERRIRDRLPARQRMALRWCYFRGAMESYDLYVDRPREIGSEAAKKHLDRLHLEINVFTGDRDAGEFPYLLTTDTLGGRFRRLAQGNLCNDVDPRGVGCAVEMFFAGAVAVIYFLDYVLDGLGDDEAQRFRIESALMEELVDGESEAEQFFRDSDGLWPRDRVRLNGSDLAVWPEDGSVDSDYGGDG